MKDFWGWGPKCKVVGSVFLANPVARWQLIKEEILSFCELWLCMEKPN